MKQARGVALVEVVVVVLLVGVLVAACLPAVQEQRRQASIKADLNGLRLIGQASAMYSDASEDRLFAFSWRPGEVPVTRNTQLALFCASLDPNSTASYIRASVVQQLDLVTHGFKDERLLPVPSTAPPNHVPYPLFNHLVLAHFMGASLPAELFASKADRHRAYWRRNMDEFLDDPRNSPVRPPSTDTSWIQLWRWGFSSSYQVGVSHWAPDVGTAFKRTAERGSTHRQWLLPNDARVLGNRTLSEVAFPGQKVMMFDEFDRYAAGGARYFALQGASNTVNFYDGHAARVLTADSNFGFRPNDPESTGVTVYNYVPFPWWDPAGAVVTVVPVYYDQTRDGLQGVDYPGK